MKTYIINLPASTDRHTNMLAQMQKASITDFEFVEAITDPIPINGCMKSHRAVWEKIAELNQPALVLEDDVVFDSSFLFHLAQRIDGLLQNAEVGLVGYQLKAEVPMHTMIQHWRFPQAKSTVVFNGAYAYIVNGKAAAEKLLQLTEHTPAHADLVMMDACNNGQLALFFMCFPLVQHGSFPSTLDHHGKSAPKPKREEVKKESLPLLAPTVSISAETQLTAKQLKAVKISLVHPSRGRSQKAHHTLEHWLKQSSGLIEIEHVLGLDDDDKELQLYNDLFPSSRINHSNNDCVVSATNHAASHSTGNILVYLSDDFTCPENWDLRLAEKFAGVKKPMLLQVDDVLNEFGTPCLTIPIMNRLLYKKLGYFWHPAYKSMFVDNDLYHTCNNNGWLVPAAELKFKHEWQKDGNDEIYRKTNGHWAQGEQVFFERKTKNFPLK